MSLPLLAATAVSGFFTLYNGFKTYSIRAKGQKAVIKLLSLGDQIHSKFNNLYQENPSGYKDGIFLPAFTVKGCDNQQHGIKYHIDAFSSHNLDSFVTDLVTNQASQKFAETISRSFAAIEEFGTQGAAPSFMRGHDYIATFVSQLPKAKDLTDQIEPIINMAKSSYASTAIWFGISAASGASYVVTGNADSEKLSGASYDEIQP